MPLTFTATQSGTDDGMSGAATAMDADPAHYVLYGKDENGVYFECDDQSSGGYGRVTGVVLSDSVVRFDMSDGDFVSVLKQMDEPSWAQFLATVRATFGEAVSHGA
ncbi:MAG: hypothetical protein ACTHLZ_14365 [Tepidisphaeraceae bacterium]